MTVSVGVVGAELGAEYWRLVAAEHGLAGGGGGAAGYRLGCSSWAQLASLDTVWAEQGDGSYTARAVTLPGGGGGDTGAELLRREVERCDQLQGLLLCHALSCWAPDWAEQVRDLCPASPLATFSGLDTADPRRLSSLLATADSVAVLAPAAPAHLAARAMAGVTAPLRLPARVTSSLQQLQASTAPLPRLNLLQPSLAPASSCGRGAPLQLPQLAAQLLSPDTRLCAGLVPGGGRQLAMASVFRGRDISWAELDCLMRAVSWRPCWRGRCTVYSDRCVQAEGGAGCGLASHDLVTVASPCHPRSATLLANSAGAASYLDTVARGVERCRSR